MLRTVQLLSLDVFDTLLVRIPNQEAFIVQETTRAALALANREQSSQELSRWVGARIALERSLNQTSDTCNAGVDRRRLYRELLQLMSYAGDPAQGAEAIVRVEIRLQFEGTRVNPAIHRLLQVARSLERRVIAVSDTSLSRADLYELLRLHGIDGIDAVYSSCDARATKFSGRLFDEVLRNEHVRPSAMLHVGDNLLSDVYAARQRGIRSVHVPRRRARSAPIAENPQPDAAFRFGYETLGPVFATYSHILLVESARRGIDTLHFVARDGYLLMRATETLASTARFLAHPKLRYAFFSRRATALAFSEEAADEGPQRQALRALLVAYGEQQGLLAGRGAIVDTGWRATLQHGLNRLFGSEGGFEPLYGFYLGLWDEECSTIDPHGGAVGLISDQRRGKNVLEGAAYYVSAMIETLCRAPHGTVLDYRMEGRAVAPVLDTGSRVRPDEESSDKDPRRAAIVRGILAYVAAYGAGGCDAMLNLRKARKDAQLRLLRLAFFPRAWELAVTKDLIATEGRAQGEPWAGTLIASDTPNPFLHPRAWLRGLRSLWPYGYVAATGGYPLAAAFLALEMLLLKCPAARDVLRRLALRGGARNGISFVPGRAA